MSSLVADSFALTNGPVSDTRLDCLPPEMLHRIMSLLPPPEVYSARLACSVLATVGAEYLTNEARLRYEPKSFHELDSISTYPAVAKGITKLFFRGDRLSQYRNVKAWSASTEIANGLFKQKRSRSPYNFEPSDFDFPTELTSNAAWIAQIPETDAEFRKRSYAVYKRLFKDQQKLVDSCSDYTLLVRLFKRCPRLDSIELSMASSDCMWARGTVTRLVERGVSAHGDIQPFDAGVHHIRTICAAAETTHRVLKHFTAYHIGYEILAQKPADKTLLGKTFRELESFRLELSINAKQASWDSPEDEDLEHRMDVAASFIERGELSRMLGLMPQLRVLRLRLPMDLAAEGTPPLTFLTQAVGATTWAHLREFGINTVSTTEDNLVEFLLRHRANLRRLSLGSILLEEGDWESLFRRIAGQFPRLQKVKLSGDLSVEEMPWGPRIEFVFPQSDESRTPNPLRDAMHSYIRLGSEYPDVQEMRGDDMDEEWNGEYAIPVPRDQNDDGYESDGSHMSYGSDYFDLQV